MVIGIISGISLDIYVTHHVEHVLASTEHFEAPETPKEVRLEVIIDWTEHRIEKEIRDAFPEDPDTAVAIAKCESGLNIEAYNPRNTNGTTDGGLWQINDIHNASLDKLGFDKYDPIEATKYARILYERNGWRDWVCYTHGLI